MHSIYKLIACVPSWKSMNAYIASNQKNRRAFAIPISQTNGYDKKCKTEPPFALATLDASKTCSASTLLGNACILADTLNHPKTYSRIESSLACVVVAANNTAAKELMIRGPVEIKKYAKTISLHRVLRSRPQLFQLESTAPLKLGYESNRKILYVPIREESRQET